MTYNSIYFAVMIGFGGFVGTLSRYSISLLSQKYFFFNFPLGTFLSNLIGCFIIGIISSIAEQGEILSPEMRIILTTGFCGGFTTMSSMIYEIAQFFRQEEYLHGFLYVLLSITVSFLAFLFGFLIIKLIYRSGGF